MTRSLFLLRSLRTDRTIFYRLFSLFLLIASEAFTVGVLYFHENGQLQYLAVFNAIIGVVLSAIFIFGAIDLAKRNMNFENVNTEKDIVKTKLATSQDHLFRIDNDTRQEVGAWLHGTLQPQLTRLAKDIRSKKLSDCDVVAQKVDEISEKFVRNYSHELFPPSLVISLEVGLETLLEGRAQLVLDHRLTNESALGFSVSSPQAGINETDIPLRLILGRERSYAAYRIIEEAVANAEKKSSTSRIIVDVRVQGEFLRLSVFDDGAPITENANMGLGHSVIDAFIQKFGGSWSLANVDAGVELVALIPYTPVTVAEKIQRKFQGGA
jgi:signal transduction histidine kinase